MTEQGLTYSLDQQAHLLERFIPLRWTGITSRVFSAWRKEGLIDIPFLNEDRERERVVLTVAEYIFLQVLVSLRLFGLSVQALKVVKNILMDTADPEELMEHHSIALATLEQGSVSVPSKLGSAVDRISMKAGNQGVILHWLLSILASRSRLDLIVFSDGSCSTALNGVAQLPEWILGEARIVVPINEIVYGLALQLDEESKATPVSLLTENEAEIIGLVRSGKASSIQIDCKEGSPTRLKYEESKQISKRDLLLLVRELKSTDFKDITVKTNGGKTVHYTQITKQKLPSNGNILR